MAESAYKKSQLSNRIRTNGRKSGEGRRSDAGRLNEVRERPRSTSRAASELLADSRRGFTRRTVERAADSSRRWDAAGLRTATIKHVTSGIDPQGMQVYLVQGAVERGELDHDLMWRCMKALPERGRIGVFNRSYYEEVLRCACTRHTLAEAELPRKLHEETGTSAIGHPRDRALLRANGL
jgi:hypothetical protein